MWAAAAGVSPKADDIWPISGIGQLFASELGGRAAGGGLERAVERADRLEAGVQCDAQHRALAQGRISQRAARIVEPEAVDVGVEVAVAEPPVDQAAQLVFRYGQASREARDAEVFAAVDPLVRH